MKRILALIGCIIVIISLYPVIKYNSDCISIENELKNTINYIAENIKNEGLYIIKNGMLKQENKNIEKNKKILGDGEFYKYQDGKISGYLNYEGKCGEINIHDDVIKIKEQKCDYDVTPKRLSTLVDNKNINLKIANNPSEEKFDIYKYYYGKDPNNYIIFMNRCWRIVGFTNSGLTKLIYEGKTNNNTCDGVSTDISGSIGLYTWDMDKKRIGNWENSSTLLDIFNDWVYYRKIDNGSENILLDLNKIENATWNIGMVTTLKNYNQIVKEEKNEKTTKKHKIGLISVSDYYKVAYNEKIKKIANNNYLYKPNYNWWTINYGSKTEKSVWAVMKNGNIELKSVPLSNEYFFSGTRISIFLKDSKVVGAGSQKTPFLIIE